MGSEDLDSIDPEFAQGLQGGVWNILDARLRNLSPLGVRYRSGRTIIKFYKDSTIPNATVQQEPIYAISVYRRYQDVDERSVWRFLADGTMTRSDTLVGHDGIPQIVVTPTSSSENDKSLLLDLARGPRTNMKVARSLSRIKRETVTNSAAGSPGLGGRSRL